MDVLDDGLVEVLSPKILSLAARYRSSLSFRFSVTVALLVSFVFVVPSFGRLRIFIFGSKAAGGGNGEATDPVEALVIIRSGIGAAALAFLPHIERLIFAQKIYTTYASSHIF